MFWVPFIISAASSVLAGYSSYQQGKAQREQANQNARQLEFDKISEDQENREAIRRQRMLGDRQRKALESRIYKEGYAMEGAPIAVLGLQLADEQLTIEEMQRQSYTTQAKYGKEAKHQIYAGQQAYRSGRYSAVSSLLKGAYNATSRMG